MRIHARTTNVIASAARYFASYQRTHPELRRQLAARRRARRLDAAGSFTVGEWLALVELWGGRCAYCGERAPLEIDHRVPLSRGGTNSIDNILPACGPCNRRKHAMSEQEFRERLAAEKKSRDQSSVDLTGLEFPPESNQ